MMWFILTLALLVVLVLVYAVLSAGSTEDEIMEEYWQKWDDSKKL